jgi:hypothetical protein
MDIKRLERDENLRDFLYHLKGIVEAADNVAALAKMLNDAYGRDFEVYADATSLLEVQALHHLGYHVKALRTPLRRLQNEAHARLESETKSVPKQARRSVKTRSKSSPHHPRRGTAVATRSKK